MGKWSTFVPRTWLGRADAPRLLRTLAIGAVGGSVFFAFQLPLAWMLGAMVFTTVASLSGAMVGRGSRLTLVDVLITRCTTPGGDERLYRPQCAIRVAEGRHASALQSPRERIVTQNSCG